MYWSSSFVRILNIQDIIKERTKETSSNISYIRVFLPPPSPVMANIPSILAYNVPHTEDVGLPTKFRFNVGPLSKPVAGSMPVNDAGPTQIHHKVCCMLCGMRWHSPNAVSMLTHILRRWSVIETALCQCTVFADCCSMLVTLLIPEPETPDNTIH